MIDDNYNWVNEMPQFPDGEAALLKYISDHLVYPEEALKDSIQGRVMVAALVTETGEIGEVVVTRSKSYKLEKAAIDVVKSLPKFKPVHRDGQPVAVWITLPVNFKLPQISRFVAK